MTTATQPELQNRSTGSSRTSRNLVERRQPLRPIDPGRRGHLQKSPRALPRRQVQWTPSSAVFTSVNFAVVVVCTLRCTRRVYLNVVASFGVGALQVVDHWLLEPFGAWSHHDALCKCLQPRVSRTEAGHKSPSDSTTYPLSLFPFSVGWPQRRQRRPESPRTLGRTRRVTFRGSLVTALQK